MNGLEAARALAIGALIVFVAGLGLMMFPVEARFARAGYSAFVAASLAVCLYFEKQQQPWIRRPLFFFAIAFAFISALLLLGG